MKTAMVAPLIEAVPSLLYGGTQRVVSALTEERQAIAMGEEQEDKKHSEELGACCYAINFFSPEQSLGISCASSPVGSGS